MIRKILDSTECVRVVFAVAVTSPNSFTVGARPINGIRGASVSLVCIIIIYKLVGVFPKAVRQWLIPALEAL